MDQTYWGKQTRAQSAHINGSGCAALQDHHRMTASRPPATAHPRQNQYMWTLKMHAPGIRLYKSEAKHAQHKMPDFLHYCAHFSRLCCPEQSLKTIGKCKMNNGRGWVTGDEGVRL
jgi:hypothetical protein